VLHQVGRIAAGIKTQRFRCRLERQKRERSAKSCHAQEWLPAISRSTQLAHTLTAVSAPRSAVVSTAQAAGAWQTKLAASSAQYKSAISSVAQADTR
jgi:uncharacterized protein YllA (UPF0747 family)